MEATAVGQAAAEVQKSDGREYDNFTGAAVKEDMSVLGAEGDGNLIKQASKGVVQMWKTMKEQGKEKQETVTRGKQRTKLLVQELLMAREKERAAVRGEGDSVAHGEATSVKVKGDVTLKKKETSVLQQKADVSELGPLVASSEETGIAGQKGQRAWAVAQLQQSKLRNLKDTKAVATTGAEGSPVTGSKDVGVKEEDVDDEETAAQRAARQRKWALAQLGLAGASKSQHEKKGEAADQTSSAGGVKAEEEIDEEAVAQGNSGQRAWAVAQLRLNPPSAAVPTKEERKNLEAGIEEEGDEELAAQRAARQRKWALAQLGFQVSTKNSNDGKTGKGEGETVRVERQRALEIVRQLEEKQSSGKKKSYGGKKPESQKLRNEALQRVAKEKALEIVQMLEETAKQRNQVHKELQETNLESNSESLDEKTAERQSALAIAKWLEEKSRRERGKRESQSQSTQQSTEKVAERAAFFLSVLGGQAAVGTRQVLSVTEEDNGNLNLRKNLSFDSGTEEIAEVGKNVKHEAIVEEADGGFEVKSSPKDLENYNAVYIDEEKLETVDQNQEDQLQPSATETVTGELRAGTKQSSIIELAVEKVVEEILEGEDWLFVEKGEHETVGDVGQQLKSEPTWAVGSSEVGSGKLGLGKEGKESKQSWEAATEDQLRKEVEGVIHSSARPSTKLEEGWTNSSLSSLLRSSSAQSLLGLSNPLIGISTRKPRTPSPKQAEEEEDEEDDDDLGLTEMVQAISQNLSSYFNKWSPYKGSQGSQGSQRGSPGLPIIDF